MIGIQCRVQRRLFLIQCCLVWSAHAQNLDSLVSRSLDFSRQQLTRTVAELQNSAAYGDSVYPRSTSRADGRWKPMSEGHWASGFLPGCFWLMYEWTSDNVWKSWAERWTAGVLKEQYRTKDHEAGFIIPSSVGHGYRLIGDTLYRTVLLQAAKTLVTRCNSNVGCIRSWDNYHFPVIIDGMNALQLLWWASKNGGGSSFRDLAVSHSVKTMENNIRPDGSCYQIVDYDPATGVVLDRTNKQGYSKSSTWSRGQAWAIYGFTVAYRETRDERFSQTARSVADYFINNLPFDYVPYWDFQAPNIPNEEKDVSAAAIAASGLLELSTIVFDNEAREKYWNAAQHILASLCSPSYLAAGTNSRGILLHGVGNRMNENRDAGEVDVSLIYADYFFIEAMLRYKKIAAPTVAVDASLSSVPGTIYLYQNCPNPFNGKTVVSYEVPGNGEVDLSIYSLLGKKVKTLVDRLQVSGRHTVTWDGSDESGSPVASGAYYCRLRTDKSVVMKRMLLIK